jgi:hypothetical protein
VKGSGACDEVKLPIHLCIWKGSGHHREARIREALCRKADQGRVCLYGRQAGRLSRKERLCDQSCAGANLQNMRFGWQSAEQLIIELVGVRQPSIMIALRIESERDGPDAGAKSGSSAPTCRAIMFHAGAHCPNRR